MSNSLEGHSVTYRYTLQERQALVDTIYELSDTKYNTLGKTRDWGWVDDLMDFTEDLALTPEVLSKEGYKLLLLPLEEMPLYLNETSDITRGVAIWRLEIGK